MREVQYNTENTTDQNRIQESISEVNSIIQQADDILENNATEAGRVIESFRSLTDFVEQDSIRLENIGNFQQLLQNPLFRFVRGDFLRAQTTAVSRLATGINGGEEDIRDSFDSVSHSTAPDAEETPLAHAEPDKIQEDDTTETLPYAQTVGSLTVSQFNSYRDYMGQERSGNDYSRINRVGFLGRYQFGAPVLQDMGYIRPGTSSRKLNLDSSWLGRDDIDSRDAFLQNREVQDALFLRYSRYNYKRILSNRSITKEDMPARVAGMLAVAHLLGPAGAKDFRNDVNRSDANGTEARTYFDGASAAVGGGTECTSPDQARANQEAIQLTTIPDGMPMAIPSSPAATQYPHNSTRTFQSGHIEEFDSTPGSERVAIKHRTGTGYEYGPDGNEVHTVNKDRYTAILGNDSIIVNGRVNIYVEGNAGITASNISLRARNDLNIMAGGNMNLNISGNINEVVSGSKQSTIQGDSAEAVSGYKNVGVDGDYKQTAASNTLQSDEGNMNLLSMNNTNLISQQNTNMISAAKITQIAEGDLSITSSGEAHIGAEGDTTLYSSAALTTHGESSNSVSSPGSTSIASGGVIALSHPVQQAVFSGRSAIAAALGAAPPEPLTAAANDNGGGENQSDMAEMSEPDMVRETQQMFEPFDLSAPQSNSGSGDGVEASSNDPITV